MVVLVVGASDKSQGTRERIIAISLSGKPRGTSFDDIASEQTMNGINFTWLNLTQRPAP